jgi:hypothetical protein
MDFAFESESEESTEEVEEEFTEELESVIISKYIEKLLSNDVENKKGDDPNFYDDLELIKKTLPKFYSNISLISPIKDWCMILDLSLMENNIAVYTLHNIASSLPKTVWIQSQDGGVKSWRVIEQYKIEDVQYNFKFRVVDVFTKVIEGIFTIKPINLKEPVTNIKFDVDGVIFRTKNKKIVFY